MKKYVLLLTALVTACNAFAQKKVIDTAAYYNWSETQGAAISPDGRYVAYTIGIHDAPFKQDNPHLIVQSLTGNWRLSLSLAGGYPDMGHLFTADSRHALYSKSDDSLCVIRLGTNGREMIPNIGFHSQAEGYWLFWQANSTSKELFVRNWKTGKQTSFGPVDRFLFFDRGDEMYFTRSSGKKADITLFQADLSTGTAKQIWDGELDQWIANQDGGQLVFSGKAQGTGSNDLWYYDAKRSSVKILNVPRRATPNLSFDSFNAFIQDGRSLLVNYTRYIPAPKPNPELASVDVWSYRDSVIQPAQLLQPKTADSTIVFKISLADSRVIRVGAIESCNGDYSLLIEQATSRPAEQTGWTPNGFDTAYLVSIKDGSKRLLADDYAHKDFELSPEGRYVISWNYAKHQFESYETATGKTFDLTSAISTEWSSFGAYPYKADARSTTPVLWLKNDWALLVYDRYDIWQLDPLNRRPPINLTNGYGRSHHIIFGLGGKYTNGLVGMHDELILSAFNAETKQNGFYSIKLGKPVDPELRAMGDYFYLAKDVPNTRLDNEERTDFTPIKAHNAEVYIVQRQSTAESPNYFITKDFRGFEPLSSVHPERDYNWPQSELINWQLPNGEHMQGILFRPGDFDPKKKYPMIFSLYETFSNSLNVCPVPGNSGERLNVPVLTSHGYLVFCPDIHKPVGGFGPAALEAVTSGAKALTSRPYVDSNRLGIYGMSFGSSEVNYIISHTHLFTAAVSICGLSDLLSFYNTLIGDGFVKGESSQGFVESGQAATGGTPWEKPAVYADHSAILRADCITTPTLLMYNTQDAWNFQSGVQLFLSLRRLGKPCWLLQYDKGHHGLMASIDDRETVADFDQRLLQFFDFYLRGGAASKWMLDGIPARLKQVEGGLDLDTKGRVPGPGLPQQRRRIDAAAAQKGDQ